MIRGSVAPTLQDIRGCVSTTTVPVARVLGALTAAGCEPRQRGDQWEARCPAHEDRSPSLGLSEGSDGRALLTCRAGCATSDVVAALRLTMADLFPASDREHRPRITGVYGYTDAAGKLLYETIRYTPKDFRQRRPDGHGGWTWELRGVERVPYRLPELVAAVAAGRIIHVVEGEKDADALRRLGLVATSSPLGAGKWPAAWGQRFFLGAKVVVLPDNDEPGRSHAEDVARSLHGHAAEVRVIELPSLPDKGDVSDWIVAGGNIEQLRELVRTAPAWTPPTRVVQTDSPPGSAPDWSEPVPLPGDGPRPPFPVDALPPVVRDMVRAVAESIAVPVDLAAVVALGVVATAVVGAVEVELRPDWREPACLYLAGIAAPGERKTPLVKALCAPLHDIERERRLAAEPALRAAQARVKTLRAEEAKAVRAEDAERVRVIAEERAAIGDPTLPRLLVKDATPEALVDVLAANRGRLGCITDEGGEVFALASRYAASSKPNLGIYLAGWDAGPYVLDRVGRGHKYIACTTVVFCLLCQPKVANDVLRDGFMTGRGLAQRFLWSWPESEVGSRPIDGPSVPVEVRHGWAELLRALAEMANLAEVPHVVTVSDRARCIFDEWRASHELRLGPSDDLASIAEWGSKLPGQVARLALVLHVAEAGTLVGAISGATMAAAIDLGGYFCAHALHTFGVAGTDDKVRDAAAVLRWARHRGADEVTVREVSQSKRWQPDRVRAAFEVLEAYGWTRQVIGPRGPGRPSERFALYPERLLKTHQYSAWGGVLTDCDHTSRRVDDALPSASGDETAVFTPDGGTDLMLEAFPGALLLCPRCDEPAAECACREEEVTT